MRTLQFNVSGQRLSKSGDFSHIIKGTKGYLKCEFDFQDTDWYGRKVAVVFESKGKEYPVAVGTDKTCNVPDQVTSAKYFKMRLVGQKDKTRIITNQVLVEQEG